MQTYMANPDKIERKWYVVDAEGCTLGRLASGVASVLRGKNKPQFTPHVVGFDDAVRGGSFAISDAYNRYPLAVKLHASDLIATYLMEQGTSNVENGHPKTK